MLGVADDAEHLVLLDELGRRRGQHRRIGSYVLVRVVDRVAVDAAVGVDAVEVDLRHLRDPREVDAGDVGGEAAELDRVAGGRLAGVHAALAGLGSTIWPPAGCVLLAELERATPRSSMWRPSWRAPRCWRSQAVVAGASVLADAAGGGRRDACSAVVELLALSSSSPQAASTMDAAANTAPTCRSFILPSPLLWTPRPRYRGSIAGRQDAARTERTSPVHVRARTCRTRRADKLLTTLVFAATERVANFSPGDSTRGGDLRRSH